MKEKDVKKLVAFEETGHLRSYLKTYGRDYSKKYKSSHFSSPTSKATKVELVDEVFSDIEEKQEYMVDAPLKNRSKNLHSWRSTF